MNRLIPWIQTVLLRQILLVCLIATTFFVSQSFTYSHAVVAQADTVKTPEGIYYKGTPDQNITGDNQFRKVQNRLQETAENVREKLNLDEETPRVNKEYEKFVQRKVDKTVEPFSGKEGSYDQQPNGRSDR